jgi:hypothetical protein
MPQAMKTESQFLPLAIGGGAPIGAWLKVIRA